jgi:hypothetical protein
MMKIPKVRLAKALIIIGLTLLIFSNLGTADWDRTCSRDVSYGSYGACIFSATSSISMRVEERDHKRFSLYVVIHSDVLDALNGTSLENLNLIPIEENITSFVGVLSIWIMGIYGIAVTPIETRPITVSIRLRTIYPQNTTFVPGLILASTGLLIIGLPEIMFLLQNIPDQDVKPTDS